MKSGKQAFAWCAPRPSPGPVCAPRTARTMQENSPLVLQEGRAAMSELAIWTYDWVPEGPRGFVRDLRLRWACEEAGLVYAVRSIAFDDRETNHLAHQPFGQIPFLKDDELEIFESGAGLLHLARKSDKLMPRDPVGEAETLQWTIAALNSIEMVTVPWWFLKICGDENN